VTLCNTRHDAILVFRDQYASTVNDLQTIAAPSSDRNVVDKKI